LIVALVVVGLPEVASSGGGINAFLVVSEFVLVGLDGVWLDAAGVFGVEVGAAFWTVGFALLFLFDYL
jgi:hypothetical protein